MNVFDSPSVIADLRRAWCDSESGDPEKRHEDGGYIVVDQDGVLTVERWTRGSQASVVPAPLDANNRYNDKQVVATFHTHPNPAVDEDGLEWEQGPSATDKRWHQRRKLAGYILSNEWVYLISEDGTVRTVGKREKVLSS